MKQLLLPIMGIILLTSCNNDSTKTAGANDSSGTSSTESKMDATQAQTDISALVDAVHNGLRQKDLGIIEKSMTSDALILGTDPTEVWSFRQFRDTLQKFFADTSFHGLVYDNPQHKIEINGNSAIIVDQFQLNDISKKMMTRNLAHARYADGKWLLDMFSWNVIPYNRDLRMIDQAL